MNVNFQCSYDEDVPEFHLLTMILHPVSAANQHIQINITAHGNNDLFLLWKTT